MSRYIDADKILPYISRLFGGMPLAVMKMAERDGIDIVRCQDCRYRYMDADLQVWTCTYGLMIKPDGFCNYGEVRDE